MFGFVLFLIGFGVLRFVLGYFALSFICLTLLVIGLLTGMS